jgi:hypothetical protein
VLSFNDAVSEDNVSGSGGEDTSNVAAVPSSSQTAIGVNKLLDCVGNLKTTQLSVLVQ